MTKRVIERDQSIMGIIFFIFKVNTVEKVLRDLSNNACSTSSKLSLFKTSAGKSSMPTALLLFRLLIANIISALLMSASKL